MIASLPLWSRVKFNNQYSSEKEVTPRTVGIKELAKDPTIRVVWLCFITSCTLEYLCNTWGSSFLVECRNITADRAAFIITFYYVGLALGRFLSGILAIKLNSWKIIMMGLVTLVPAVALILLPLPSICACVGLFLIGLGNGPMYPNFMHLTPSCFGADIAQSVISTQMAVAYVSFTVMPFIFGGIVKLFGMASFPVYFTLIYALLVLSVLKFAANKRKTSEAILEGEK